MAENGGPYHHGGDTRCVVLVLCGLPGAGKSTLARRIQAWLEEEEGAVVHYVGFDAIEASLRSEGESWSLEAWHAARATAFEQAKQHLTQPAAAAAEEGLRRVLVLDDNMYYRSMRRAAYKLAAGFRAGYACVWVDVPLDVALARNAQRPPAERVEAETVLRMAERLERPDPGSHSWEGNFVRVEVTEDAGGTRAAVRACVEAGWAEPATIPQVDVLSPEELEAARRQTRESALHATDLALRRMIGAVMKAAARAPQQQVAALGPLLSQAKATVMKEVGSGALQPLYPLIGEDDSRNRSIRRALAERLQTVVVEGAPDPEVRAWVGGGLWAEAGLVD